MTSPSVGSARHEDHNREQRAYFEATVKPTMVPVSTPYVLRQVDEVIARAGIAPGASVLDVGCGMGRYTLPLAERGLRVEGLDLSPTLLERLRAYEGGRFGIPLHCADVMAPPSELLGRFDAVTGFFALHHFHDIRACYAAMARLVRPGGRVVFLEPNPWNALYWAQITFTPRMKWSRERIFSVRRGPVFDAMARAGLVRPSLERFGFFPPFVANRPAGARLERVVERFPPFRPFLPFQVLVAERP
jgi:SAM-dependent methyltransferase